jgi:transcriptional regulator with XRE-family HTH domain
LLGWSREDLAAKSGVGAETAKNFELRGSNPTLSTVNKWRRALHAAGVELIEEGAHSYEGGPGVRLRGARAKR